MCMLWPSSSVVVCHQLSNDLSTRDLSTPPKLCSPIRRPAEQQPCQLIFPWLLHLAAPLVNRSPRSRRLRNRSYDLVPSLSTRSRSALAAPLAQIRRRCPEIWRSCPERNRDRPKPTATESGIRHGGHHKIDLYIPTSSCVQLNKGAVPWRLSFDLDIKGSVQTRVYSRYPYINNIIY